MDFRKRLALVLVLVFLMASIILLPIRVRADTDYTNLNGKLIMISPKSNTTYTGNMPLNFTIDLSENGPIPWFGINEVGYSVDGNNAITLSFSSSEGDYTFWSSFDVIPVNETGLADISGLANGIHELRVFADGACNVDDDGIFPWNVSLPPVYFSVYNVPPPKISLLSPQNNSYEITNVTLGSIPLNFSVDEATSWIGYSIDNQNNETISGNTTLTGLSEGQHSLTIFANDTIGNMGASQTMNFTIAVPTGMNSKPFQTVTVAIVSVAAVVVAIAGLLVHFKKRKQVTADGHE